MNNQNPKIFGQIIKVMNEIGVIGKKNKNDQQNYNFRGIDDVYNALNPALIMHGVFIAPTILSTAASELTSSQGKIVHKIILTVRFRFYADDGSWIEADTIGEAFDFSDKASNKAMSAAYKYACFQVFCIPTKDLTDSENENIEIQTQSRGGGNRQPPKQNQQQPPKQNAGGQTSGGLTTGGAKHTQIDAIKKLAESKGADIADQVNNATKGRTKDINQMSFDEASECIKTLGAL